MVSQFCGAADGAAPAKIIAPVFFHVIAGVGYVDARCSNDLFTALKASGDKVKSSAAEVFAIQVLGDSHCRAKFPRAAAKRFEGSLGRVETRTHQFNSGNGFK